jgi:hypothetical protein
MTGAPSFLDGRRRNASVELFLKNVKKRMAGTYICRAQLFSLMDEKILTLSVLCKWIDPLSSKLKSETVRRMEL